MTTTDPTETTLGYGTAAELYWNAGWRGVLPLRRGTKKSPPGGRTGYDGIDPSFPDLLQYVELYPDGNLALRMPDTVIGIDVDDYDGKTGAATLAEAERRWGTLPPAPMSTSRTEGVSGIRYFCVPAGTKLVDQIRFQELGIGDIEIIQHHHRYGVVWPSTHPDTGNSYWWMNAQRQLVGIPAPSDFLDLSQTWIDGLQIALTVDETGDWTGNGDTVDVEQALTQGVPSERVLAAAAKVRAAIHSATAHDSTRDAILPLLRCGLDREPGVYDTLRALQDEFIAEVTRPGHLKPRTPDAARNEFARFIKGAGKHLAKPAFDAWMFAGSNTTNGNGNTRAPADQPPPPTGEPQPQGANSVHYSDEEFWQSRQSLINIRDYAFACMVSPWGLLGVLLIYALDLMPYSVGLPGIADDDSPGSLNLFVALVAQSGGNKGRTERIGRQYMGRTTVDIPPGSGEGLVKMFARRATKDDYDAEPPVMIHTVGADDFVMKRHEMVLSVPEIDTLAALFTRNSSTLPSIMRQAFSGETLGFSYADEAKRVFVPEYLYRLGVIVGVQPQRSAVLLDDAAGGTPQRFLWLPMTDPRISRLNRPAKPTPTKVYNAGGWRRLVPMCAQASEDIEIAAEQRAQGTGDPLDGHLLFVRAKTAAGLAMLDGRLGITDEDWQLAGEVIDMSNRTRQHCIDELSAAAHKANEARGRSEGVRATAAEEVRSEHQVDKMADWIVKWITEHGPEKRAKVYRAAYSRTRKEFFTPALRACIDSGRVTMSADELLSLP